MEQFKKSYWLTAVLTTLLGIVLVIWPGMSVKICCMGIGIAIAICGITNIVQFLKTNTMGSFFRFYLILGIILTIIGLWLVARPESIMALIPTIVGIVILLHGTIDFYHTWNLKNMGYDKWWFGLAMSILTMLLAILIIVNPFAAIASIVVVIGCVLIFDGLKDIILLIMVGTTKSKMNKGMKDLKTIDVDILKEETFHE